MDTTIQKLFKVEYGQKEYHNKKWLEGSIGKTALISSKGNNNGIYGFFDIKPKYTNPVITVPSTGTIGHAFLQEMDCCIDDNCLVLIPKKNIALDKLHQITYQIRLNKWRYKYGRQITPKRLENQVIKLIDSSVDCKKFIKKITPKKIKKAKIKESTSIKPVPLIYIHKKQENGLCYLNKKTALPQNQLDKGITPYVTTSSFDNGVTGFFDLESNFEGKCLTVALNGSVGEVFFQFDDFITSGDNAVLTLQKEYNPSLLFYISVMIKNHQWRYNYYKKLNLGKLNKMKIPMPFKGDGIDFGYIEKIVSNSYGFDELKEFL